MIAWIKAELIRPRQAISYDGVGENARGKVKDLCCATHTIPRCFRGATWISLRAIADPNFRFAAIGRIDKGQQSVRPGGIVVAGKANKIAGKILAEKLGLGIDQINRPV